MFNLILNKIILSITGVLLAVSSHLVPPTVGSQIPLVPSVFETSLASPISTSDTSMTLSKGTLIDGSTLSGYVCFTVDSGQPNLEYICGTASGTAVTSLTRGINPLNGTSSVSALIYSHRRGANVKITDYPSLTILSRMAAGLDGHPAPIRYDSSVTNAQVTSDNRNLVNYSVLVATAISGAVDASTVNKGITRISVAAASSTSPIAVGDNDPRVPPINTSTMTSGQVAALLGSSSTPSTTNRYITQSDVATTSTANAIVRASSSGIIDGAWLPNASSSLISRIYAPTTGVYIASTTVLANTLGNNGVIKIVLPISLAPTAVSGVVSFSVTWGSATTTISVTCPAVGGGSTVNSVGTFNAFISAAASTTAQRLTEYSTIGWGGGAPANPVAAVPSSTEATTTVDSTVNQVLRVFITSSGCGTTLYSGTIEIVK